MPRVLIVDDHPVNRKLPSLLLRDAGWICEEAEDGASALAILAGEPFDAVLLDISMPGISGDEVCRRIRADQGLRPLYVVAYTAHATEESRHQIQQAGFDALLTKPITKQTLLASLAPVTASQAK